MYFKIGKKINVYRTPKSIAMIDIKYLWGKKCKGRYKGGREILEIPVKVIVLNFKQLISNV